MNARIAMANPGCFSSLSQTEIHLWKASIDSLLNQFPKFINTLSSDELDRANRYRFDKDRQRFVIGRGLLRHLASRYLKISPNEMSFVYGPFGKPSLGADYPLEFNVSHSGNLIVYAFAIGRKLGIDIEKINPDVNALELAAQVFSSLEIEELTHLSDRDRQQAFYRLWVRKEAMLKATGEGFSRSPVDVNVPGTAIDSWQIRDLDIAPDYAAALVTEGTDATMREWNADELTLD